jgi:hypothetical protein
MSVKLLFQNGKAAWLVSVFILLLGMGIRAYFSFFLPHNIDEYITIGYVNNPSWASVTWDNYPPFYYLLGKFLGLISPNHVLNLSILSFALSSASLFLIWKTANWKSPLAALLASLYAVSYLNSTMTRPVALVEFFAALNFFFYQRLVQEHTNQKEVNLWPFSFSAIGLLISSYSSLLYFALLFFLAFRDKVLNRQRLGLFLGFLSFSTFYYFSIKWGSLGWIRARGGISDSIQASYELLKNIFGYSRPALWIFLGLFVWDRSVFALAAVLAVFLVNPILGTTATEPRFLISIVPLILWMSLQTLKTPSHKIFRTILSLMIVGLFARQMQMALDTRQSGFEEAMAWLKTDKDLVLWQTLTPVPIHAIDPERELVTNSRNRCIPKVALLFSRHTDSAYFSIDRLQWLTDSDYKLIQKKEFAIDSVEPISIVVYERDCSVPWPSSN